MSMNKIVSKSLFMVKSPRNVVSNQVRNMSAISSPPTFRMPFPQKVMLGGAMILSTLVIPAWVLCNVKNYNKRTEE